MLPVIRDMYLTDLEQVMFIEKHSFSTQWSSLTYVYEIQQSSTTHMGVITLPEKESSPVSPPAYLERFQFLRRSLRRKPTTEQIIAYGGVWVRMGEAHISTIASHENYRGRGLGELMLVGLLGRGIAQGATHAALEVRVSNTVAQNLYQKYGFVQNNVIPHYYHDNREDAYLMKVPYLNETYVQKFKRNLEQLSKRIDFKDHFSGLRLEDLNL